LGSRDISAGQGTRIAVRGTGAAYGSPTPHDGRYIVAWNPHSSACILALTPTADRAEAYVFDDVAEVTPEHEQPGSADSTMDGNPNRPLMAIMVEFMPFGDVHRDA
jgi:hypothetical protein